MLLMECLVCGADSLPNPEWRRPLSGGEDMPLSVGDLIGCILGPPFGLVTREGERDSLT